MACRHEFFLESPIGTYSKRGDSRVLPAYYRVCLGCAERYVRIFEEKQDGFYRGSEAKRQLEALKKKYIS